MLTITDIVTAVVSLFNAILQVVYSILLPAAGVANSPVSIIAWFALIMMLVPMAWGTVRMFMRRGR